jgi:agmatine deiminase
MLGKTPARFHRVRYGDIWLRDTGPVFLGNAAGERACASFAFNGWAGRYVYPGDEGVSREIAVMAGLRRFDCDLVFEGGAVETDGEGSCLAARDCLLSPERNPAIESGQVESFLGEMLGVDRVLWLSGRLQNDHTDGHADTLARFTAPGRVMCMKAADADDPNAELLDRVAEQLLAFVDARGRRLELESIPSPGLVRDEKGQALPASYLNFYVGNRAVVVPTYGSARDHEAVRLIARAFPGRRTVGLPALAILQGGGAFHCITLNEPL